MYSCPSVCCLSHVSSVSLSLPFLIPHSHSSLLLLLLLSRCPPSSSSAFRFAYKFNGDLSAWDVRKVTHMAGSECTTVHPCCVVSSSCLLSRLYLSLSLPFLIPHTHLSSSSSSSLDVLPLHHQCFMKRISSTETSRHGMSGVSPICFTVSVLLSIPAVLSLPHVSSPVSML